MKLLKIICLYLYCLACMALAEKVTLAWDPNPEIDLAGYELHYGTDPENLTTKVAVLKGTEVTVDLVPGEYHFYVVAFNTSGLRSMPSERVTHRVEPTPPGAPQRLRVILQSSADLKKWDDELEVLNTPPGRKFWRIQTLASN